METLKERLAWAHTEAGGRKKISYAALARACHIKPASVSDWFSGKTKTLAGSNLLATARLLNVNPDWLATGKGRRRLNGGETELAELAERDVRPLAGASQPTILDPNMLHEALTLLVHDEGHGGDYSPRKRAVRLADLYARVVADGGRLTDKHNAEFEAEVRERAKGARRGDELDERRRAAKRRG